MDRVSIMKKILNILLILIASLSAVIPIKVNSQINLPSLDIKFEPSGTHVDTKGNLKIRLDFYPTPESKSYEINHVYIVDETSAEFIAGYKGKLDKEGNPVDQKDYDDWFAGLPHIWQTNPCLSHFIVVPPDIDKSSLDSWIKSIFSADVTATIDDSMTQENSAHLISPYMRTKAKMTTVKMWDDTAKMSPVLSEMVTKGILATAEASSLTTAKSNPEVKAKVVSYVTEKVNITLSDYSVASKTGGTTEDIKPGSIDVGAAAIDRASTALLSGTNVVEEVEGSNPANADGIIDTCQIFVNAGASNSIYFLLLSASGNVLTTESSVGVGTVSVGSTQTFTGLSLTCSAGYYLGAASDTAGTTTRIDIDSSGGTLRWAYSGSSKIPVGSSATYTPYENNICSIYATGTEAGGGWANIGKVGGVGEASLGKINGVSKANIGKLNGVTP